MDDEDLFTNIIKDGEVVTPEPYIRSEYFNQECSIAQAFDLIINDVSGISSQINDITNWFKFAPNNSGIDGIKFTINILKNFKDNKFNKTKLIFPVLGLSNRDKITNFLRKSNIFFWIELNIKLRVNLFSCYYTSIN